LNNPLKSISRKEVAVDLEAQGKTLSFLQSSDHLVAIFAAPDTLRAETPAVPGAARALGIHHMELLSSDNERTCIHNTADHFGKLTLYTIIQRISTANLAGVSS
jgi:cation transport ATPase